jgi:hypothetical protein
MTVAGRHHCPQPLVESTDLPGQVDFPDNFDVIIRALPSSASLSWRWRKPAA